MSETLRKRNAKIYLDWVMERVAAMYPRMPALGGAMVLGGETVYTGARGIRKRGNTSAVQIDDRFQLGSITKPMTGYLLAVLRKQGKLNWNRTIGTAWPDLIEDLPNHIPAGEAAWVETYRNTTIAALMTHSSGFDYMPATETNAKLAVASSTVDAQLPAKRRIYTQLALRDRPWHGWTTMAGAPPPAKYSGGCIVAAAMAEGVTGRSWEQLMSEQVFGPLGITRFCFANASSKSSVTDLWQHQLQGSTMVAKAIPEETQISYTHSPAGAVSMSLGDWAKFAKSLLRTSGDAHISMTALDEYFTLPGPGYNCTNGGWFGANGRFAHDGCNMWNYASMLIDRHLRLATLAATNCFFDGVTAGIYQLREEMECVAAAWPAMEHLHEALALDEISCSANSTAGSGGLYHATLMADQWFRTHWRSASRTPTLTFTLQNEGYVGGIALCQVDGAHIQDFELTLAPASGLGLVLKGAALDALTTRDGLVIKVLFGAPRKLKKITLKVLGSSANPTVRRVMVMACDSARAKAFDIASDGKLWTCDPENRVLTTGDTMDDRPIHLGLNTGGLALQVRKAAGKPWVIGMDGKLWRGEPNGWVALSSTVGFTRLDVDEEDDAVWAIDSQGRVRRFRGNTVAVLPAIASPIDLCVNKGRCWIVGPGQAIWTHGSDGWVRLPGSSPFLRRVAVDRSSGELWALGIDNSIFRYDSRNDSWIQHAGGGKGKEIAVHRGLPYVIGMDDGIWRSAGANGWQRLELIQPRG
jgi:CubicO group peptidase (beta-lactamase class C family)